jgi:predicted aspartyl protease
MLAASGILFYCLALTQATVVRADALPDSQTLRSHSDAAYGPSPNDYREIVDFRGTSAAGTRTTYRLGADRRVIVDAGAVHTESGVYKGDSWHENENGHVVYNQDDPGLATRETFTTTVSRVSAPIDAYVIATLNAKGHGRRDFIDPTSYFVVRREEITASGKSVTLYDDFRAFGSRHLAAHWRVHDETTGTDTEYTLRDYAADAVADSDVVIPRNKRALVQNPAGQNTVVLPSVFERDGHILVRLMVGARGLDFVLDTGASSITLDPGVASSLGLTVTNRLDSSVNAGRFKTGDAVLPAATVGALTMHDVVVHIVPLSMEESAARAVGLLGFDFLCESGITIDYEHQTVTAERYGTYTAPTDPRTIALDIRLGTQQPITTVSINGTIAERVVIDTGGFGPFLLFDYFTRRHPDAIPRAAVGPTRQMLGAGGTFNTNLITVDDFALANVHFKQFEGLRVASDSSYSNDEDGLIGPTFLRLFDVHLDYPEGKIFLVPNASGSRAMHEGAGTRGQYRAVTNDFVGPLM